MTVTETLQMETWQDEVRRLARKQDAVVRAHNYMPECHVHAGISPDDGRTQVAAHPDAELLVHPECGCATSALWLANQGILPRERTRVLSPGGMVEAMLDLGESGAGE